MARGYRASEPRLEVRGKGLKELASLGVSKMGELSQDSYRAFEPVSASRGFKNDRSDPTSLINAELNFRKDKEAENGAVYDLKTGKPIFAKSDGNISGVSVSMAQIKKMRELGGDALWTHNHPGSSSFSMQDVNVMIGGNVKEFRAVSERYVYTLTDASGKFRAGAINLKTGKHKDGFTLNDLNMALDKEAANLTSAEDRDIANIAMAEAAKRGTSIEQEEHIAQSHLVNEKLFRKMGLDYRRIPIQTSK